MSKFPRKITSKWKESIPEQTTLFAAQLRPLPQRQPRRQHQLMLRKKQAYHAVLRNSESSSSFRWLQFMSRCWSPLYATSAFSTLATIPAFQIFDVCFFQLHFLFLARCLEVAGVVGLLTDRIEVRRFDTFNK